MTDTVEATTLDQWYPIHTLSDLPADGYADRLLGCDVLVSPEGVTEAASGRALPTLRQYRYLWASLGAPPPGLFALPEALGAAAARPRARNPHPRGREFDRLSALAEGEGRALRVGGRRRMSGRAPHLDGGPAMLYAFSIVGEVGGK